MKNISIIMTMMVLFLISCNKENDDIGNLPNNQRIYFQYDYINSAWGYQHSGWLVDSSGNVFCYNNPENWIDLDSLGYISSLEMDNNIMEIDSLCYTIDKNELNNKLSLIYEASKGVISEPIHEMYDAGGAEFSGYLYNAETKMYKQVLLKLTGDYRIDNSSPESFELHEWLKSIQIEISSSN
ncbi:hypothetical protein [Maribellus sediminis]|uniref:hypothetical protein n=1 Tax=Maribellus sediminis TaxID=2696285 RepID=UPI001430E87A|nr:hypothetical protein [Maribellus sediminis]